MKNYDGSWTEWGNLVGAPVEKPWRVENGATKLMKAEEYTERNDEIDGWPVRIITYRIGDRYYCTIDNVDPGARFARADGSTLEDAERASAGEGAALPQADAENSRLRDDAVITLPASISELQQRLAGQHYVADRGLAVSLFLALRLKRPLFLEGEAGVGKTALAGSGGRRARHRSDSPPML